MTALMIDLDGVLYEGEKPVPGAVDAVGWLRNEGIPHLFVTNTTSRSRRAVVEKLSDIGIEVGEDDVLTPPVAAASHLVGRIDGAVALFVQACTVEDFAGLQVADVDEEGVAALVVGDYGERWNFSELNRAFRLLMRDPQPLLVALGMTRYWQADDGLRLDTAPFVVALAHASGAEPVVLGKPAKPFFESALDKLGVEAKGAVMIGDDIRGDVGGAQRAGIAGVLVRTGKFRETDLDGDVTPAFVIDSIAALPERWREIEGLVRAG